MELSVDITLLKTPCHCTVLIHIPGTCE